MIYIREYIIHKYVKIYGKNIYLLFRNNGNGNVDNRITKYIFQGIGWWREIRVARRSVLQFDDGYTPAGRIGALPFYFSPFPPPPPPPPPSSSSSFSPSSSPSPHSDISSTTTTTTATAATTNSIDEAILTRIFQPIRWGLKESGLGISQCEFPCQESQRSIQRIHLKEDPPSSTDPWGMLHQRISKNPGDWAHRVKLQQSQNARKWRNSPGNPWRILQNLYPNPWKDPPTSHNFFVQTNLLKDHWSIQTSGNVWKILKRSRKNPGHIFMNIRRIRQVFRKYSLTHGKNPGRIPK